MIRLGALFLTFLLSACTSLHSTLKEEGSSRQVLYAIEEERAFQIAFSALTQVLPGYEITDVDGPVRGYSAVFRFVIDTYTQQVMVFPASGKDPQGRAVRGYYFEVSGAGSAVIQGQAKNRRLFEIVQQDAKDTGKGIAVTELRRESYVGVRWKQGEIGKTEQPGTKGPTQGDTLSQIERLREMRDRNTLTEDEFQKKKKELLDRL